MRSSRRIGSARVVVAIVLIAAGCSGTSTGSASGEGSNVSGVLTRRGTPVPDAMLSIFARSRPAQRVAFAITDASGHFRLLAPDGQGSVTLPAGEYSVTVESLTGALNLPTAYSQPARTPIQARSDGSKAEWNLELGPADSRAKPNR